MMKLWWMVVVLWWSDSGWCGIIGEDETGMFENFTGHRFRFRNFEM